MLELFKAEFLRYRKWALLAFIGQLGALVFVSRMKPLFISDTAQHSVIALACIVAGLAFGLAQMYLVKRKNNWTWLIQRPIGVQQIYMALSGAAAANLIVAVPLGWLVMTMALDIGGNTLVDTRHYVYGAYMFGLSVTSYLVGSLAMLSASRGAVLLISVMVFWLFPQPQSMPLFFAIMGLICLGYWYLNYQAFKPDLSRHVEKPAFAVLMGLPMQAALVFILMLSSTVYYHIPRFLIGNHPDNTPVEGTLGYLWHIEDDETLSYLLRDQDIPGKDRLIRQSQLAESDYLSATSWIFPSRGQMYNRDITYGLVDRDTKTRWLFSHDLMLLRGSNMVTGAVTGWIGMNGFVGPDAMGDALPFQQVPFLSANQFLVSQDRLLQVNFADRELVEKFIAPEGEQITSPPKVADNYVAIMTDKHARLFDREGFLKDMAPAVADYTVEHPIPLADVRNIETKRMVDGYLVLYFSRHYNGFQKAGASVHYARLDGAVELVAKTDFPLNRHPAVIDNLDYVLSPVIYMLRNQIFAAIEPQWKGHLTVPQTLATDYPRSVLGTAIFLMVLSGFGVFVASRRFGLGRGMTLTWTLMGSLLGLPALVSFFLMNNRRSARES